MRTGAMLLVVVLLAGCAGADRMTDPELVRVAVYAAPSRDARGGVVTYEPWNNAPFPVTGALAPVEGFTVTCSIGISCTENAPAGRPTRDVAIRARVGTRAELVVSKPGFDPVR